MRCSDLVCCSEIAVTAAVTITVTAAVTAPKSAITEDVTVIVRTARHIMVTVMDVGITDMVIITAANLAVIKAAVDLTKERR